jgi:integrase
MIPRGDNRWLLRVYLGRDAEGKRKYHSKMFEGTTHQARQEITKLLREADTDTLVRPTKQTVKAFLEAWLKSKLDVSEYTVFGYHKRLKNDVYPEIGHLKLHEVTPLVINGLYQKLSVEKGHSPRTVRYTASIIHHAFEQAVMWGLLVRNPASHATRPKLVKRPPTVLTAEQIRALLAFSQEHPLCSLWYLLLTSGLRPSEALVIRWSDIEDDTLHVRRTLVTDSTGYRCTVVEHQAKTDKSIRAITLPASTLTVLDQHRRHQAAEILAAGPGYTRAGYLFASANGEHLQLHAVRLRWKTLLRQAGMPNVRLYDTRHSHATALLTAGANLAWVSDRLGHTDIKMTKDVYAHVLPEAQRDTAQIMDNILTARPRKVVNAE